MSLFVDERQENQNVINAQFDYDNEMYSWQKAQDLSTYYTTLENQYITQLNEQTLNAYKDCLLYTSPSPRDKRQSRMPSSA